MLLCIFSYIYLYIEKKGHLLKSSHRIIFIVYLQKTAIIQFSYVRKKINYSNRSFKISPLCTVILFNLEHVIGRFMTQPHCGLRITSLFILQITTGMKWEHGNRIILRLSRNVRLWKLCHGKTFLQVLHKITDQHIIFSEGSSFTSQRD